MRAVCQQIDGVTNPAPKKTATLKTNDTTVSKATGKKAAPKATELAGAKKRAAPNPKLDASKKMCQGILEKLGKPSGSTTPQPLSQVQ